MSPTSSCICDGDATPSLRTSGENATGRRVSRTWPAAEIHSQRWPSGLGVFRNRALLQRIGAGADISFRANSSDPCLRTAFCMKMRNSNPARWRGQDPALPFLPARAGACIRCDARTAFARGGQRGVFTLSAVVGPPRCGSHKHHLRGSVDASDPGRAAPAFSNGRNRRGQLSFRQIRRPGASRYRHHVRSASDNSGRGCTLGFGCDGQTPPTKEAPPCCLMTFNPKPGRKKSFRSSSSPALAASRCRARSPGLVRDTRLPVSSAVYRQH